MRRQSVARLKAELPGVKQVCHNLPPTFADLAADPGELLGWCMACHHDAVLPVAPVLARYGPTKLSPESERQVSLLGLGLQAG